MTIASLRYDDAMDRGLTLKYRPELDGLRACAVSLVVATHANIPFSRGGSYGVDVFFVLSGYLITQLLVSEWMTSGDISLRRFYVRRALRLYPTLLTFLIAYIAAAPFLFPPVAGNAVMDSLVSALYLSDYTRAFSGVPYRAVAHTWSLSVEEHFYILWPLCLLFIVRRASIQTGAKVMFAAFLLTTAWRLACVGTGQSWDEVYFRFDTRASGLALGCAFALFIHGKSIKPQPLMAWLGASLLLFGMTIGPVRSEVGLWFGFTIAELATLAIIYGITFGEGVARTLLVSQPVAYVGKLSYGIYLWHVPLVFYLDANYSPWLAFSVGGVSALIISIVSYETIERFSRRISARLKYDRASPPTRSTSEYLHSADVG